MKDGRSILQSAASDLQVLNERAALRWFLYCYRLRRPEVLARLAEAPCEREDHEPVWARRIGYAPPWRRVERDWFSEWCAEYGLPLSEPMREVADATATIGCAGLKKRRWGFEELPPGTPPDWKKVTQRANLRPIPAPQFTAILPGRPLFVRETDPAYTRWKRKAVKLLEDRARQTAKEWERVTAEFLSWQPEEQWFLAPGSLGEVRQRYPVPTATRDLTWLALKQATGAGYRRIPHDFAEALAGRVPDEFLRPEPRGKVKAGIRRAADLLGLGEGRIRRGRGGRPKKGH